MGSWGGVRRGAGRKLSHPGSSYRPGAAARRRPRSGREASGTTLAGICERVRAGPGLQGRAAPGRYEGLEPGRFSQALGLPAGRSESPDRSPGHLQLGPIPSGRGCKPRRGAWPGVAPGTASFSIWKREAGAQGEGGVIGPSRLEHVRERGRLARSPRKGSLWRARDPSARPGSAGD